MENFNFKVGDKVTLDYFYKNIYLTVTAIGASSFLATDMRGSEMQCYFTDKWQLYQPTPEKVESEFQELFNFLNQEHNLICTEEQMSEIILEVQKFLEKDKEVNKSSKTPEKVKLTKFYVSDDDKYFGVIFSTSKEKLKELEYKHIYTEKEFLEKFDVEI